MGELGRNLLHRRKAVPDKYFGGRELKLWAKEGYGNPWQDYQESFEVVWPEGIAHFLSERKAAGQPTTVLDVMSPTNAIVSLKKEVNIDGGIALTLEDLRQPARQVAEAEQNIHVVSGDIVRKKIWSDLRRVIQEKQPQASHGFDLILSRSIGGANNIPVDRNLYYFIVEQLYENLSFDDGLMLLQCPSYALKDTTAWIETMRAIPTLEYRTDYSFNTGSPVIALRKHAGAPDRLPALP